MTDLGTYADAIDKAFDLAYMNDQLINENTMGEFSGNLETLKAMYKSHFVRKYLSEKGILTELADIVSLNDEGESSLDLPASTEEHMLALIRSMVPTVAVLNAIKSKMEKASDELGFKTPEDVPEAESGGGDSGGGDEFGGGGDEFDMGFDQTGQTQGGEEGATQQQVTQQVTTQQTTQEPAADQAPAEQEVPDDERGTL